MELIAMLTICSLQMCLQERTAEHFPTEESCRAEAAFRNASGDGPVVVCVRVPDGTPTAP